MKHERRTITPPAGLELRVEDSTAGPVIHGYGAVFDEPTELWPGFEEVIRHGAFDKTIAEGDDVRSLVDHNPTLILGRRKAETLEIGVDEKGLFYRVTPPDTRAARDIVESIKRGDVDGSSFGFSVIEDGETFRTETADGESRTVRELLGVRLYDLGPVTFPAYAATSAGVRAAMFQRAQAGGVAPELLEGGMWDLETGERIKPASAAELEEEAHRSAASRRNRRNRQRMAEFR